MALRYNSDTMQWENYTEPSLQQIVSAPAPAMQSYTQPTQVGGSGWSLGNMGAAPAPAPSSPSPVAPIASAPPQVQQSAAMPPAPATNPNLTTLNNEYNQYWGYQPDQNTQNTLSSILSGAGGMSQAESQIVDWAKGAGVYPSAPAPAPAPVSNSGWSLANMGAAPAPSPAPAAPIASSGWSPATMAPPPPAPAPTPAATPSFNYTPGQAIDPSIIQSAQNVPSLTGTDNSGWSLPGHLTSDNGYTVAPIMTNDSASAMNGTTQSVAGAGVNDGQQWYQGQNEYSYNNAGTLTNTNPIEDPNKSNWVDQYGPFIPLMMVGGALAAAGAGAGVGAAAGTEAGAATTAGGFVGEGAASGIGAWDGALAGATAGDVGAAAGTGLAGDTLSKAALDGTNSFGANSVGNALDISSLNAAAPGLESANALSQITQQLGYTPPAGVPPGTSGPSGVPPPANPFSQAPSTLQQIAQALGGPVGQQLLGSGAGGGLLNSLGGIGNLANIIGGLTGAQQQGQAANDMKSWLQGQQAKIDNLYNPGTPEYNALWDEMSRKDAAAGRNSQYGPRSVDLAARVAQIKADETQKFTTGTANAYSNALNQNAAKYAGLLSALGAGSTGGGVQNLTSFLNSLTSTSPSASDLNNASQIGVANSLSDAADYQGANWSQFDPASDPFAQFW